MWSNTAPLKSPFVSADVGLMRKCGFESRRRYIGCLDSELIPGLGLLVVPPDFESGFSEGIRRFDSYPGNCGGEAGFGCLTYFFWDGS